MARPMYLKFFLSVIHSFLSVAMAMEDSSVSPEATIKVLKEIEQKTLLSKRITKTEKQTLIQVLDEYEQPQPGQTALSSTPHYGKFFSDYVELLTEEKKQQPLTKKRRREIFESHMTEDNPLSSPIKVQNNQFLFINDLILPSPQKQSVRKQNLRRVLMENKNFIGFSPQKRQKVATEMHHLSQSNEDELIVELPDSIHRPHHGLLHTDTEPSQINRSQFAGQKKKARRVYAVHRLIDFCQQKTPKSQID